ncbi:vacuolar ATP synthase subunit [Pseudozyma hubeiensis SY62]|uniref:Vacuolar ATP synthase subunit n=1 Tax=Pseudozyma hubeiensis (strain SY62) TaxID=1305764 RepID=R9NZ14_PSEHS|nr:vacuolar ATP synthase subunit [Pseudozyma hubeiensis SY62]GAC94083.1 vacuolar ATP synthase subunit [Pseudozyma hubeiensis SY62]
MTTAQFFSLGCRVAKGGCIDLTYSVIIRNDFCLTVISSARDNNAFELPSTMKNYKIKFNIGNSEEEGVIESLDHRADNTVMATIRYITKVKCVLRHGPVLYTNFAATRADVLSFQLNGNPSHRGEERTIHRNVLTAASSLLVFLAVPGYILFCRDLNRADSHVRRQVRA